MSDEIFAIEIAAERIVAVWDLIDADMQEHRHYTVLAIMMGEVQKIMDSVEALSREDAA